MTRIFVRDEDSCGQNNVSAEEHVNHFDAQVLFGRTHDIGLLSHAWIDPQSRLFLLHGETGIGKTALLHKWLHTLQKKDWHDAEAIFVWSFSPPDLAHAAQDPVEEFFRYALYWFGGEEASRCPNLLQGECLAKLVQSHHTLLILDGLEILQFKTGSAAGSLADPRLSLLLERLAKHNTGLCIAVSREPLVGNFTEQPNTSRHELEKLPLDAAVELLTSKGVQADNERLRQMALDYGQNPLTLGLLGGYLSVWHGGDWRQMEKIPVLMDQQAEGRQARRILVANSTELADKPGEAILYLLSMLYRPTHWDALEALLGKERGWSLFNKKHQDTYASLIGSFTRLNQQKRYLAILQLRELGLVELSGRCFWLPQWVSEAYQRQLKHDWPQTWKEANQRLMQYYATLPKETDLSAITPLIATQKSVKIAGLFGKPVVQVQEAPTEEVVSIIAEAEVVPVPVMAEIQVEAAVAELDLNWLNSLTPVIAEVQVKDTVTFVTPSSVAEVVVIAEPAPPVIPAKPAFSRSDVENLSNLIAQLKNYQNSLQMLQIRTKKFQKHVRQLDKEVASVHYPFAKTGTN